MRTLQALLLLAAALVPGPACASDDALGLPPQPRPDAAQVELGRALFFDRSLSVNGTLSCAMCHVPAQGFTVNQIRTAVGMQGASLRRNAPTLLNVSHASPLFLDGRAQSLQQQALQPFTHPAEFANPGMAPVLKRISATPAYRPLLNRAFGRGSEPTPSRVATALAAFERSLVAAGSPFDRWRYRGEPMMSAPALRGYAAFRARGCESCHPVADTHALFTDNAFHNTGIRAAAAARAQQDLTTQLVPGLQATLTPAQLARIGAPDQADEGRFEVTGVQAERRAYRTPTLRNVALTAPYMHDGSLLTLEDVLAHYAAGGTSSDPLQDRRLAAFAFDPGERDDLIAFLRSLTSPAAARLAAARQRPTLPGSAAFD
jgi:cytochrome c peroxidase